MKAITEAIMTKYNASTALKTANTGGMWFNKAPQKTSFPYITFMYPSGYPEWTFTEQYESVTVQFSIWSDAKNSSVLFDIHDKLIAAFDWCTLNLTGYTSIFMERISNFIPEQEDDMILPATVMYKIEVKKN